MSLTLTDILLREVNAERSDAVIVKMGAQALIQVPKSQDVVAYYVLDGKVTIEAASMENPVVLHAGEYALLNYGSKHLVYADARRPACRAMTLSEWPVGDEPKELKVGQGREKARFISAALRLIHIPSKAHFENPIDDLFSLRKNADHIFKGGVLLADLEQVEAACSGPGANAFINTLMNMHLTHVMRCAAMNLERAFHELSSSPYLMSSDKSRAIATAVRLLRTHPEKNWTVSSLAHAVGLSRSTFAAMFRNFVAAGPMAYLGKVRMEKAAELLMEQRLELPLYSIANRLGYGAASSFARAFKSHFGLSPRAFCKRKKIEAPATIGG